jgi:hypothetical protein
MIIVLGRQTEPASGVATYPEPTADGQAVKKEDHDVSVLQSAVKGADVPERGLLELGGEVSRKMPRRSREDGETCCRKESGCSPRPQWRSLR